MTIVMMPPQSCKCFFYHSFKYEVNQIMIDSGSISLLTVKYWFYSIFAAIKCCGNTHAKVHPL